MADQTFVAQGEKQLLRGNVREALRVARMGLTLAPHSAALWELAAICATQLANDADAANCWLRVIELAPATAHAYNDLAIIVERYGRTAEAESLYRTALELKPGYARAYSNLGVLLTDLGRAPQAEDCFRAALAIAPDFQRARLNLAQLLLSQGRYGEAWPLHEDRLSVHLRADRGVQVGSACRQWQGQSLAGKSILILPEQGLGDEIQFCRYLSWLKAQGPALLTLACWPSQKTLMQTLAGPDAVIALSDVGPHLGTHDYWAFLLSLPLRAATELGSVPAQVPYLFADPARVRTLPASVPDARLRVGLVWRGNPLHSNDAERSLPGLDVLAPLWSVEGARFFSLQKSLAPLPAIPAGLPLIDLAPQIDDWADSAALLVQLDLLISVDTSSAHLAGALGLPCWILLPAYKTDWRWLSARTDSPWYPQTRLFRQPLRGDWQTPVGQMVIALRQLIAKIASDQARAWRGRGAAMRDDGARRAEAGAGGGFLGQNGAPECIRPTRLGP